MDSTYDEAMRSRVRSNFHSLATLWLAVDLFLFVAIVIFDSDAVREPIEHFAPRHFAGLRIPSLMYAGIDWIGLAACTVFVLVFTGPPWLWFAHWVWQWLKAKRPSGMCRSCGYDLTGNVSGI